MYSSVFLASSGIRLCTRWKNARKEPCHRQLSATGEDRQCRRVYIDGPVGSRWLKPVRVSNDSIQAENISGITVPGTLSCRRIQARPANGEGIF